MFAAATPRRGRTGLLVGLVVLFLMLTVGGVAAWAISNRPPATPVARWQDAPAAGPSGSAAAPGSPDAPAGSPSAPDGGTGAEPISMTATGDIIMAQAPGRIPPNNGKGFFDNVKQALAADLVMGNLEEPLTEDTGFGKCGPQSTGCHQFRAPPAYAAHLREAGFQLLNLANNHANDFGGAGHRNTQKVLEQHGLAHTGDPGQITVVTVKGVRVAVLGFSSYQWSNSLIDLDQARAVVLKAIGQADIVVVQVHMGAEGASATKVRPGTEMFLGENRGDPIRFAHTVIDAGADLVIGHGPHVLRALEFYQGRLIAYSLGNFAGGAGTLQATGNLGLGAVLRVSLRPDGTWAGGTFTSTTHQGAGGLPRVDTAARGLALVRSLCQSDFPSTGAKLGPGGDITRP